MSATAQESEASSSSQIYGTFLWGRLGTILALVPLGLWTAFHIWSNLAAFAGAEAWEAAVTHHSTPIATAVTSAVVLLPLLIHIFWGARHLTHAAPNNARYGYFNNLRYGLQRLSAIAIALFLGAHIWLAFLHPRIIEGQPERFADLAQEMHHNLPTLLVYLAGTFGVAYHLGNGIGTAVMGLGLVTARKSLRRFDTIAIVSFLVFWAMSWAAIYALYTAGGAMGAALPLGAAAPSASVH